MLYELVFRHSLSLDKASQVVFYFPAPFHVNSSSLELTIVLIKIIRRIIVSFGLKIRDFSTRILKELRELYSEWSRQVLLKYWRTACCVEGEPLVMWKENHT